MIAKLLRKLLPAESSMPPVARFALNSGERQTGLQLADIRHDHVARYRYACDVIGNHRSSRVGTFGLDVFCGRGYGTQLLAQATQVPTLGIDASDEAIAVANSHYATPRTLFVSKLFPFAVPAASFDFVVCVESVEHVRETGQFLRELINALKPGGLLVLSTPNAAVWCLEKNPNPFHYRHFSRGELLQLLTENTEYQLHLLDWQGPNLYRLDDGRIVHPLATEEMDLHPQQEGQILLFALEKQG